MKPTEQQISYQSTNTYATFGTFSETTKNVWIVFHGMGYLSRYFIKYFKGLDPATNYVIAPQAPSKYYQDKKFKYIGASWLTRENIELEKENSLAYVQTLWEFEKTKWQNENVNIIGLGYSQGASVLARWIAKHKIILNTVVLHSGAIPDELTATDFEHLPKKTEVTYIYGDKDEYITEARETEQRIKAASLFDNRLKVHVFQGNHEVNVPFINSLQ